MYVYIYQKNYKKKYKKWIYWKNLYEHEEEEEEENYYKPVRVSNFWSNNCIECESNSDRNKALSVEEYLNKVRPYKTS